MKRTFLLLIFTLSTIYIFAQNKEEVKLQKSLDHLRGLMIEPNADQLNKLLDDNLSYGHSSGLIEGKQSLIGKLLSGDSDFVTIDNTDQEITLKGKTAIVRHNLAAKTSDKGVANQIKLKVMLVWVKDKKDWKLLGRQAVKNLD